LRMRRTECWIFGAQAACPPPNPPPKGGRALRARDGLFLHLPPSGGRSGWGHCSRAATGLATQVDPAPRERSEKAKGRRPSGRRPLLRTRSLKIRDSSSLRRSDRRCLPPDR
jgi:hypothetical protein